MRDLICDVSYCAVTATFRHESENVIDVSASSSVSCVFYENLYFVLFIYLHC